MNQNTSNATVANVVSDAREEELLGMMRTLHGKVLVALQEVGQKPTFEQEFGKCGSEDYKNIHQACRTLISAKRKARWEAEVKGIREGINVVVSAAISKKGAQYAQFLTLDEELRASVRFDHNVIIPLTSIASAFPKGTTEEQMVARCKELSHTVAKGEKGYFLKVAFAPPAPKTDTATKAA
jgi:hypothetical protein